MSRNRHDCQISPASTCTATPGAPTLVRVAVAAALGLLTCAPVFAGAGYKFDIGGSSSQEAESFEVIIEGRDLKMALVSGAGSPEPDELIFRGARPEMLFVDHDGQSFMLIEKETLDRLDRHDDAAVDHMQKALRNVSPEQRAMIEATVRQNLEQSKPPKRPKSRLQETGERAERHGYPCRKVEVYRGDSKIRELWVTEWSNLEGGDEVEATFEEMGELFGQMVDSISGSGLGTPPLRELAFEHLQELDGFPVLVREFNEGDGTLESEISLGSTRIWDFDPEEFKPPYNYGQKEVFAADRR